MFTISYQSWFKASGDLQTIIIVEAMLCQRYGHHIQSNIIITDEHGEVVELKDGE